MKATTWLCPVLTLLCATRLVCTAQRGGYPLDYADSNMIQDDYLLEKRNKPSLSIVNPLDVLRQRLLLEIARRQMKENTRQVELNRAILKNVGKRIPAARRYQMSLQQQQQQLQQLQQLQQHLPQQLRYVQPPVSILDFLQRPTYEALLDDEKKSLDVAAAAAKQRLNGNEIGNETNHGSNKYNDMFATGSHAAAAAAADAGDGGNTGLNVVAAEEDADAANIAESEDDLANEAIGGYQMRNLYRLHKNHFAKK